MLFLLRRADLSVSFGSSSRCKPTASTISLSRHGANSAARTSQAARSGYFHRSRKVSVFRSSRFFSALRVSESVVFRQLT